MYQFFVNSWPPFVKFSLNEILNWVLRVQRFIRDKFGSRLINRKLTGAYNNSSALLLLNSFYISRNANTRIFQESATVSPLPQAGYLGSLFSTPKQTNIAARARAWCVDRRVYIWFFDRWLWHKIYLSVKSFKTNTTCLKKSFLVCNCIEYWYKLSFVKIMMIFTKINFAYFKLGFRTPNLNTLTSFNLSAVYGPD